MKFIKTITRNDLGLTGSHQAGWALNGPSAADKFEVFPTLSPSIKNDERQIHLLDPTGASWNLRYIYFNSKSSEAKPNGRDEYRLTKGRSGQTPADLADSLGLRVGDKVIFTRSRGTIHVQAAHLDRADWGARLESIVGGTSSRLVDADAILDTRSGLFGCDDPESASVPDKDLGYVYVLSNSAMPDLCKIGFTTRSAEIRAVELTEHSGVPARFDVEGAVRVKDPRRLEKLIHDLLEPRRLQRDREFFKIDSREAFSRIRQVAEIWSEARPLGSA